MNGEMHFMPPRCSPEELKIICDATVRLVEIRQRGCAHLSVEDVAPQIMSKLLTRLDLFKAGKIVFDDLGAERDTPPPGYAAERDEATLTYRGRVPDLKALVSVSCLATKCKNNRLFCCNLKKLIIGKIGVCASYELNP